MKQDIEIPPALIENTQKRGLDELRWLQRLPHIARDVARRWELSLGAPFANVSFNYVTLADKADGQRVVLKLSYPGPDFLLEAAALRCFDGAAAARLLDADLDAGALLLEHLVPGEVVQTLEDDVVETSIAASVMRALWRPQPREVEFPRAAEWLEAALSPAAIPDTRRRLPWIDQALQRAAELAADPTPDMLLHGDLHHENILSGERLPWLAIDPHGVVGEPEWEIAPFLFNNLERFPSAAWPQVIRRRADQFAEELSLEHERVYAWSAVRAIQSAFWSLRDDPTFTGAVFKGSLVCAQALTQAPR
jgi:streptomycin 6-kinase